MKITAAFVLGVIVAGLAIYKAPRVQWFRDEPRTPAEWAPRYRQWRDGEETPVEKRILELQDYWTKELQEEVSILPMGYITDPTEVGLWVGGTFITAYKHLEEIENYLETYFMVKEV